jgi:hypothetical protein
MVIRNEMLEDRDTCFLSESILLIIGNSDKWVYSTEIKRYDDLNFTTDNGVKIKIYSFVLIIFLLIMRLCDKKKLGQNLSETL